MTDKHLDEYKKVKILDIPCKISFDNDFSGLNTFINPYSALILQKHRNKIKLDNFNIYVDGIYICWLELIFKSNKIARISFDFTSIAHDTFSYAVKNNLKIAIIGGNPGIAEKASKHITDLYPGIDINFTAPGFFKNHKEKTYTINKCTDSDIVITGMGTPLQEQFLIELKSQNWKGSGYTCGGFLDQIVEGKGMYYPPLINKYNLRWLYRIYKEPNRLLKRYTIDYLKFTIKYLSNLSTKR